jgi:hypothetical protein
VLSPRGDSGATSVALLAPPLARAPRSLPPPSLRDSSGGQQQAAQLASSWLSLPLLSSPPFSSSSNSFFLSCHRSFPSANPALLWPDPGAPWRDLGVEDVGQPSAVCGRGSAIGAQFGLRFLAGSVTLVGGFLGPSSKCFRATAASASRFCGRLPVGKGRGRVGCPCQCAQLRW